MKRIDAGSTQDRRRIDADSMHASRLNDGHWDSSEDTRRQSTLLDPLAGHSMSTLLDPVEGHSMGCAVAPYTYIRDVLCVCVFVLTEDDTQGV